MVTEAALASVAFAMFLFSIFDFCHIYYVRSMLQHAVSEAARYATIGGTMEDPLNPGQQLSREDSVLAVIDNYSLVYIDQGDISLTAINGSGQQVAGPGGPGDVMTVRVTHSVDIITPLLGTLFPPGGYEFSTSASFRNEEFPGAGS